ncbi:MAG: helix-hairpin-helix domain-containing protein, partial [Anaerolineales bacterium]|nr:helix-hairpin-helix domain-containing protein [Anaerolineales bacterium]
APAEAAPLEAELPEAVPAEELPAWLMEEQAPAEIAPLEAELPEAVPTEELPAWLMEEQAPVETVPVEAELPEAVPTEELPAWLFEEQATREATPLEAELPEAIPTEELPAQFVEAEIPPVTPEPVISSWAEVATPPTAPPAAQTESSDADAAFAWLESLAVKQGADEALLLQPEDRREAPPEWVQEAIQEAEQELAPKPVIAEVSTTAELPFEEPAAVEEAIEEVETELEIPPAPEAEIPMEAEAIPSIETSAPSSEAPIPDWLEQIEEPATDLLADTKPSRVIQPSVEAAPPFVPEPAPEPAAAPDLADAEAAFAWLESLAVKQGADEALLLQPEERLETPPEWVIEAVREAEAVTEFEAEHPEAETISEVFPDLETPLALEELAEELPKIEQPIQEIIESPESSMLEAALSEAPVEEIPAPEQPITTPSATEDQDAAFAWMESLAVRQGADEALLLKPEERRETLPEWVLEGIPPPPAEVIETPVVESTAEISAPEIPAAPAEEMLEAAAIVEEAIPAEPVSPPTEPPIQRPAEELPELPTWLTEAAPESAEDIDWTPPPVKPPSLVELNRASLVELERLPGVGFIMAQQIINFRDSQGAFGRVEDLLKVPGFTQAALNEIQDFLYLETSEAAAPTLVIETRPATGQETPTPAELTDARSALARGDLDKAVSSYNMLVRSNQSLDEVILDLEEFTGLYPEHIAVWQCLGDAYLRVNQVKKALDAYVRAEKLLR